MPAISFFRFCLLLALCYVAPVISFALTDAEDASKGELVFAHVVYRHGDRAPGKLYPNDPYGMDLWPQGLAELSTKGMMQHYHLGKYLRRRYSKLLSKRFSLTEIYVRSSDKNRALQSAASDLAGLYPPAGDQVWNPKLDWQPVPIHSVPTNDDYLLVVDNPCARYDEAFLKQTKPVIDEYNERYKDFFTLVKAESGLRDLDFWSIGNIYDPLYCESAQGLALPSWTQSPVNKTTGQTVYDLIVDLKNIAKNLKYNSDEKALLTGGYLLGDILTRMTKVAEGANSTNQIEATKMIMYSAHDDTLMALLYAMNVVQRPFMVPYAAAVLIDLYRTKDGRYYVEASYKNDTPVVKPCEGKKCESADSREPSEEADAEIGPDSSRMIRFTICGCPGAKCPLETFVDALWNRTAFPQSKRDADCAVRGNRDHVELDD